MSQTLRNIALIAHVDHGKTTLVDSILKQSGLFRTGQVVSERMMDTGDLEKERGITILAKPTSVQWQSAGGDQARINIIDTPGHADFGGEVERILSMTDGVILLVDSAEGPMPQTKFVLGKALAQGLRPIVVINKVDRPDGEPDRVIDEVFDLFVALDASSEQLDFPCLYASGRDGWAVSDLEDKRETLAPLMETVLRHVPPPASDAEAPFAMLATLLSSDPYLGRCLIGRVAHGSAKLNAPVRALDLTGHTVETGRLTKLLAFEGTDRVPVEEVHAGDIICIAGLSKASVSDTICAPDVSMPLESTPVDPPTMSVEISVNDSPFAGLEGDRVTTTLIRDRLLAEAEANVAITFEQSADDDAFLVGGRGELQLGVLIETMRREGFELAVSRPRVVTRIDSNGDELEPYEEVTADVDEGYSSTVVNALTQRKGEMRAMTPAGSGKTRLVFVVPTRGLIGYQSQFLTDTRGTGVLNRLFHSWGPWKGALSGRSRGALIASEDGVTVPYALFNLQSRGALFVEPKIKVYLGMIVGEHSRDNDLDINVSKGKKLTNIRASGSDQNVILTPPRQLSLEDMMTWINDDELLEVTPKSLRLRKRFLLPHERKRKTRS